jgi:hypothetical protein
LGAPEVKVAVISDAADFASWLVRRAADLNPASLTGIPMLKDGRAAAIAYVEERDAEEFAEDTLVTKPSEP